MRTLLLTLLCLSLPTPGHAQEDTGEPLRAEVEAFFAELGSAVEARDTKRIRDRLDLPRMFAELESMGLPVAAPMRFGFSMGLVSAFRNGQLDGLTGELQLRAIEPRGTDEARAVIRMRNPDFDVFVYVRWWLIETEDGWRAYDWMDLDTGLRATLLIGAMLQEQEEGGGDVLQFVGAMTTYANALAQGDWAAAEEQLAVMADLEAPAELRTFYWLSLASMRTLEERYGEAVEALERADALGTDAPMLDYQWAVTLLEMGESAAALEHAEAYRTRLGGDAEIDCMIGAALADLGRGDEAWVALMRGMDDDPRSIELLIEVGVQASGARLEELRSRLRAHGDGPAVFDEVAAGLLERWGLEGLGALCDELDALAPDDPNVEYYRAELLALDDEYLAAAELLLEALPRAGEEHDFYLQNFLQYAGVEGGRPVWAYERVPEHPRLAFDMLGYGLAELDDPDGFDELAALHEASFPDDARLPFHRARRWRWAGEYERAEELFALAAPLAADDEQRAELLELRVDNLVLGGSAEAAYGLEPREQAWQWILDSCLLWEEGDVLLEALALRRADVPQDPELSAWTGLARWFRGEDEAAAEALLGAAIDGPRLVEWGYEWTFQDALVRSCARSGHAARVLPRVRTGSLDPLLVAIVHAHLADDEQTVAAVRSCLDIGWDQESLLLDDDLGPRLARPEIADALGWR